MMTQVRVSAVLVVRAPAGAVEMAKKEESRNGCAGDKGETKCGLAHPAKHDPDSTLAPLKGGKRGL